MPDGLILHAILNFVGSFSKFNVPEGVDHSLAAAGTQCNELNHKFELDVPIEGPATPFPGGDLSCTGSHREKTNLGFS